MVANRFYVQPGGDYSKGLAGLSSTVEKIGERKREEEAARQKEEAARAEFDRVQQIRQGAADVLATKDPEKIKQYMVKNPEISTAIKTALETKFPGGSADSIKDFLFASTVDFSQAPTNLERLKARFLEDGVIDQQEQTALDKFQGLIEGDQEAAKEALQNDFFMLADKEQLDRYDRITKAETSDLPTTAMGQFIKNNPDAKAEELIDFTQKLSSAKSTKQMAESFAPSPLKKLIDERQALLDAGMPIDHPDVQAYNSKITGTDINLDDMTQDEIDFWGANVNLTGKVPSLGRGKQSTKIRMAIAKSAARQALGADENVPEGTPEQTPSEAALETVATQADTKAIQGSLSFLDKQLSSMGSFVTNLNSQVDKVKELSEDLKTFDTRLLNIPLRTVRGKIKGSPLQAKYDMYLAEIEAEIGKLATGSTGSVAELSAGAQEKWSQIHDKNLSVKDMLSLLEETKEAANFRYESVRGQLDKTRSRMRTRDFNNQGQETVTPTPIEEIEAMKPGDIFIGPDGKQYRRN